MSWFTKGNSSLEFEDLPSGRPTEFTATLDDRAQILLAPRRFWRILPFPHPIPNFRSGARPWKNAFAEYGGPTSAVRLRQVCELIQALRPGSIAAAIRHR